MAEQGAATPEMWAFVDERCAAAADGVERAAWENIAAILRRNGRFARQLQMLLEVAHAELAVDGLTPQAHAMWAANVAATAAFLARFPLT